MFFLTLYTLCRIMNRNVNVKCVVNSIEYTRMYFFKLYINIYLVIYEETVCTYCLSVHFFSPILCVNFMLTWN